jgi:hypothetical protein
MKANVIIRCPELLETHGALISKIITEYMKNHYSLINTGKEWSRIHILQGSTCFGCYEKTLLIHHTEQSIIVQEAKQTPQTPTTAQI